MATKKPSDDDMRPEFDFKGAERNPYAERNANEPPIERTGDGMRKEYDFSGGERGKYAERFSEDVHYVAIDPELVEFFGGPDEINEALRTFMAAIKASPAGKKRA